MHIAQSARGSKDEGCCVLVGRMAQRNVTTDATFRPVLPSKCVKNFLIVDYIQPWSQFKKMIWFWRPGLECNNFQRSDQPVARCARCRYQTRMECGSAVTASLVRIIKQNRFIMGNQTQPVTNCLISWDTIWNKTQLLNISLSHKYLIVRRYSIYCHPMPTASVLSITLYTSCTACTQIYSNFLND